MFDGRDYHQRFEEACAKLAMWAPEDEVRTEFEQLEWILLEGIRGAMLLSALIPSLAVSVLLGQLFLQQASSLVHSIAVLMLTIVLAATCYWLSRFVFWAEVSRHIRGRKFGA